MTTFAVCAKGTYLYPHATVAIKPGHTKTLKVSCPAGSVVIGGGVNIIGGDHADEVRASEPADGADADHGIGDAWFGAAGNGSNVKVHMKVTGDLRRQQRHLQDQVPRAGPLDHEPSELIAGDVPVWARGSSAEAPT